MRVANLNHRLALLDGEAAIDVETASDGRFGADPQAIYDHWEEFAAWARETRGGAPYDRAELQAPVPRPRQVFALGLNYALHAEEAGLELPPMPLTFTQFPTCIVGPEAEGGVATERVDWEVELVAGVGRGAQRVAPAAGGAARAGVAV